MNPDVRSILADQPYVRGIGFIEPPKGESMARPVSRTVDYFPHKVAHGKTMFILESRYGNNGYAFWFKLLEMLGKTDGHCLDLSNDMNGEFLAAETKFLLSETIEILDLLAKLEAIDKYLWTAFRVIWCQNFIDGIKDAYRNRKADIPEKPVYDIKNKVSDIGNRINDAENPHTKVKESKVKESKVKESKVKESKDTCVCPHQKIIEIYHKICPMLPKVVEWTATRQGFLKTRWTENKERQNLDWWEQYFIKVSDSDYLTGKKIDFRANLEWLVRPSNFIKVIEGNYDNRNTDPASKTLDEKNAEVMKKWLEKKQLEENNGKQ